MLVTYDKNDSTFCTYPGGLKGNSLIEPPRSESLKQTKNAKATGTHLRWGLYALTGLVFGVLDWFYLIWLTFDLRQALTLNPRWKRDC